MKRFKNILDFADGESRSRPTLTQEPKALTYTQALQSLRPSILAVKPAGFVSSVTL